MNTVSYNGIKLICSFEGCRLTAYDDMQPNIKITNMSQVKGTLTIGYGHTGNDVYPGLVITQAYAEALLKIDIKKYENKVNKYDPIYKWTVNELDALTSFCYNVGSIDQLTNNGKRSKSEIYKKIPEYNKSGGKVLEGLTRRRKAEAELFAKDGLENVFVQNNTYPVLKKGSKSQYVLILQAQLIHKKYLPKNQADSIFGPITETAVKKYQKDNNLKVDGIVGKETWGSLNG